MTRKELRDFATAIQSRWDEFASELDPVHFTVSEISTIKRQHISPVLQAEAMLDSWHSKLDNKAHRGLLIEVLIKLGQTKLANEVFGGEVVKQVMPQN